jgi:hypothetical protein
MTLRMMMTTLCGKTLAVVVLPLNENVIKDRIRTSMSAINTGQSLVFFLLFHSLTRQYRSLMAKKVRWVMASEREGRNGKKIDVREREGEEEEKNKDKKEKQLLSTGSVVVWHRPVV